MPTTRRRRRPGSILQGAPTDVFHYGYNGDGELTSASDNNSAYAYTYNAEGEVTSQGDVGSPHLPTVTLTYAYDPDGNETSMSDSLGGVVSYTYDVRDELTSMTFSGTGLSAEALKFTYDNAGNMTGLTRYSNLAETTVVASTTYSYDAADQMTGITDKNSSGTTQVSYGYIYDAASRVTTETRTWASGVDSDTLNYTYTNNNQLTGVTHTDASFSNESFSWDANGNQTGTGYTTSTGNEQTASPGYTYTYDADGNIITATNTLTNDTWTYSYDFRNRMTGAVETNSSHTVLAQVTYTYDALDNRIGMDENGTQTWTLYDGATSIMDFNGSGSLTMRYLNGPAGDLVDTALVRQSSGGTISWYLPDRLGTIRDLVNNAGAIIDHVDYSAFGTALDESSPSNGDRMMGFAGMERDTVTGLNLAVHRVENPTMGRWMSRDPLGFNAWDADLYRYVGNEPTGALDPSGLLREGFWWGLAQGGANLGNSATDVGIGILNTPGFVWNSTAGWILPNIPYIKAPDWSKGYFIDEDPLDRAISRGAGDVAVSCALFAGPFKRFLPRARNRGGLRAPYRDPYAPPRPSPSPRPSPPPSTQPPKIYRPSTNGGPPSPSPPPRGGFPRPS